MKKSHQFENIEKGPSLSDQVSKKIENAILEGRFPVDSRLPTESELTAMFDVSRTVIREALYKLKASGLIKSKTGSGSFVIPYGELELSNAVRRYSALNQTREHLMDYIGFRRMIESESVKNLAANPQPKVVARLGELIKKMEAFHETDVNPLWKLDMQFHQTIIERSENRLLSALFKPLMDILYSYESLNNDQVLNDLERIHGDHRRIYKAIKKGDPEAATTALEKHILYRTEIENKI